MTPIIFTIPGQMRGKQRARVTTRGGFARAYTPKETTNAEAWVKHCAVVAMGGHGHLAPLEGPLSLTMTVEVEVPASWSQRKKNAAVAGEVSPTSKPDLDNITKLVADACNGIVWRDDSQITVMALRKRYSWLALTTVEVSAA